MQSCKFNPHDRRHRSAAMIPAPPLSRAAVALALFAAPAAAV
jgi:hypothetical protein